MAKHIPHSIDEYDTIRLYASLPSTIQLENGLTATLRSCGDPSLNAVKEKLFGDGDRTPPEYCCVASIPFEDETFHILLRARTLQKVFNQALRKLRTNLNAAPSQFSFMGVGYEIHQQVHLYFWNKNDSQYSQYQNDAKAAKTLWKGLTNKVKPSVQILLSDPQIKFH
jgi:hypothetical protein